MRTLLDAVRPGGLLLAVYHDLDDEHREHMKSRGFDPADYVGVDDLGRLLEGEFTVEQRAVEPRIDPPSVTRSRGRAAQLAATAPPCEMPSNPKRGHHAGATSGGPVPVTA